MFVVTKKENGRACVLTGGGGEGPHLQFLIPLCTHSFLLCEGIAVESLVQLVWGSGALCACLSVNVLANKCC